MGSVGKKIKKVVKKVMRPKVLLPLAAIALGGPALMGGLKGAALGTAATPMGAVLHGTASMAPATSGLFGAGGKLALGKGSIAKGIGALMKSPIAKGVMTGLKNPFSVPGALTYGGLGALGLALGSKGGPEQGSDPVDRAALNQANYNMMRMYGEKAGYTDDEINTIYGPLGQMMGGEYTEVAANPNQRRRIQYPGTNYPIYTTQGAADGGRIGLMGGGGPGDLKYAVESFIRDFPEFENLGNEELYKEMEKRGYLNDRDDMYLGGRAGYASGKSVTGRRGYKPMSKHYDTYDDIVRELDDPILDKQQQDIIEQMREMSEFDYAAGGRAGYKDGKKVSRLGKAMNALNYGSTGYLATDLLLNPLVQMISGMPLYKDGGRIGLEGGGMSNMMMAMSDPDPMAERFDMLENLALDMYKKPLDQLSVKEIELLEGMIEEMDHGYAVGGRVNRNMGGIMNAGSIPQTMQNPVDMGMQLDGRGGGFIPMGAKPRADDVPAMLSKDEFVMTRDAVKGLGDGDVNVGAQKMYDLMNQLEAKV